MRFTPRNEHGSVQLILQRRCHQPIDEAVSFNRRRGPARDIGLDVVRCEFCAKPASGLDPATRLLGDPNSEGSWERGLAAMCARSWKIVMDAGGVGKRRRGSDERWWLGQDMRKAGDRVEGSPDPEIRSRYLAH